MTLIFSGFGAGAVGVDGAGSGVVVDAGASLTGLGFGSDTGGTGAAPGTFSSHHAAANPSLPPGSRTRTHWLTAPILDSPSASNKKNSVPAGTLRTRFAMLEVSVLER